MVQDRLQKSYDMGMIVNNRVRDNHANDLINEIQVIFEKLDQKYQQIRD